jgi:hypothetical protein
MLLHVGKFYILEVERGQVGQDVGQGGGQWRTGENSGKDKRHRIDSTNFYTHNGQIYYVNILWTNFKSTNFIIISATKMITYSVS